MTTARPEKPSGSACWKCASSGRRRRSSRGSDHAMRSSCERAGSSIASTPSGHELRVAGDRGEAQVGSRARAARAAGSARRSPRRFGGGRGRRRRRRSRELFVDGARRRGDLRPGREPPRAPAWSPARCRRESTSTSSRVDVGRIVAGELLHRRAGARDDRAPAGERLGDRDPEPLVERRVDEAARAAVEAGELLVRDGSEPGDVRRRLRRRPSPRAPTTRSSPSTAAAIRARFLRGSSVPTARTKSPVGGRPVRREDVLDRVRHDADLRLGNAEPLLRAPGSVCSDTAITRAAAATTRGTAKRE